MPTAAKLLAALSLGLLAMIVSEQFKPQMPPQFAFGNFTFVNAAFALVIGWKLIGARVGQGRIMAINSGVTAVLALLVVLLFYHSSRLMLLQSMNATYDGLVDALQDVVRKMLEYGLLLGTTEIITTLVIGAVISGLLSDFAARRWR